MPWEPNAQTIAASDALRHHPYDGGGTWDPASCVPELLPHAARLRAIILREFPEIHISRETGRCTPMQTHRGPVNNLHSVGRALDCMTPHLSDEIGEALANWCVQHAAEYGIQLVIWDDRAWQGSSGAATRWTTYTSRNPSDNTLQHRDHVHVEVTLEPAAGLAEDAPLPFVARGDGRPQAPEPPMGFRPSDPAFLRFQSGPDVGPSRVAVTPTQTRPVEDSPPPETPRRSGGGLLVFAGVCLALAFTSRSR